MRARKKFTLLTSNEDMNDVIKIIKSLEDLVVKIINYWSYWNSKTWNKKQEGGFLGGLLAPLVVSLVQPVIVSVLQGINRRRLKRAGRGYIEKIFWSCSIL